MNRYLSTVGLYARWNLYKILTIILITALAAGFLVYRYPIGTVVLDENYVSAETGETTQLVASYPKLEGVVSGSGAPVVCAAGFAAIVAVMSLTGCGYGVKTEYTIRRLRVKERQAVLLWAAYHAVLLVIYWAVLAAALSTVLFSYRQRRGSFSVMVLLALAGTIGSFFCGLGENANALLMVLLLGVAGAAFVMLIGGDKDAA